MTFASVFLMFSAREREVPVTGDVGEQLVRLLLVQPFVEVHQAEDGQPCVLSMEPEELCAAVAQGRPDGVAEDGLVGLAGVDVVRFEVGRGFPGVLEGQEHVAVPLVVEPLDVAEVVADRRQVVLFEEVPEFVFLGAGVPQLDPVVDRGLPEVNQHDLDVRRAGGVAETGADVLGLAVLLDDAAQAFPLGGAGVGQSGGVEQAHDFAGVHEVPCPQEVPRALGERGVHHDGVVVAHAVVREPVGPHDSESLVVEDRAQVGRRLDAVDLEVASLESVFAFLLECFDDVSASG